MTNRRIGPQVASQQFARGCAEPVAFLSYAHTEQELAIQFREALAGCGLRVLIDVDDLKPTEDIAEFARRCVRTADATVCLVSAHSLASSWVVFEALSTLHKEYADTSARLIACALDQSFADEGFRLIVTESIDRELRRLDALVRDYLERQLDMNDIVAQRSRLIAMRGGLGDILARLRSSLTLTLSATTLGDVAVRVADHLREQRGLQPSRSDPRDIRARAEELRRHMWDGRTEDALDRLLDFVREFSDAAKHVRDATFIANILRRIEKAEREKSVTFSAAEEQRQAAIYKLLELIDQIELNPQLPMAS